MFHLCKLLLSQHLVEWAVLLEKLFVSHGCGGWVNALPPSRSFELFVGLSYHVLGVLW